MLDFYNERRRQCLTAKANDAHVLVAELEKHYDVTVVTQNVDDLHEKAGSSHIVHLHGELMKGTSERNPNDPRCIVELDSQNPDIKLGDKAQDGSQLRPFIVWFGESVPEIENAALAVEDADILLIIGTSLNVYPAAGLIHYTRPDCPIYVIDPKPVSVAINRKITFIQKKATAGMRDFYEMMGLEG